MDQRTFGRMFLGRQPGQRVSGEQLENDRKQYEYFVKRSVDEFFKSKQGPAPAPQFMSITNAEGRVIDGVMKPDGSFEVIEPQTLNTQQGMFTMRNPTNAAPIIDPRTGQQVMGYAAEPLTSDTPQTIGAYGAQPQQTPTPTQSPAPQAAPTPSPTPAPAAQANQMVRVIAPDGRQGSIPAAQVDQALQQGFRLAP